MQRAMQHFIIVFITSLAFPQSATATDFFPNRPNNDIKATPFNTTVSYRQNMCPFQDKYNAGDVDLRNALMGADINIVIGNDPDSINLDEDGNIDPSDPGLLIDILDEIAQRGGFSWRNSFVIENFNASNDKTWTDMLLWSIDTYDVTARWWVELPSRIAKGASFPKGWYDASLIIIVRKDENTYFEGSGFDPFNWSRTFSLNVWLSLIGILIATGITLCFLEETTSREIMRNPCKNVTRSKRNLVINVSESRRQLASKGQSYRYYDVILKYIHDSFLVMTGHLDLQPDTLSGRLVSFSLSLFAFLFLASFAANLVAFLVNERAEFLTQVNTLQDVIIRDKKVCVYGHTATDEAIRKVYPDARTLRKDGERETLLGLKDGECDYAVVSQSAWNYYGQSEEVNSGCNLVQIGKTFKEYEAGFAMRSDAGTLCTSLVRDVFHVHLHELYDEGFLDQAWERHLAKQRDLVDPCLPGDLGDELGDAGRLDMTNLGGAFIFHGFFLALAIVCRVVSCLCETCPQPEPPVPESDHEDAPSHSGSERNQQGPASESDHEDASSNSGSNDSFQLSESKKISFVKFESGKSLGHDSNIMNLSRSSSSLKDCSIAELSDRKRLKPDEYSFQSSGSSVLSKQQSQSDNKSCSASTPDQINDGLSRTDDMVTLQSIQGLLTKINEQIAHLNDKNA